MTEAIDTLIASREHELIALRRRLHAQPELSFEEHGTTAAIVERLQVAGLQPHILQSGTGVVCDVPGNVAGPMIVLRADIDALAMPDGTSSDYRSRVDGVAHACGHDAHTAIVLGAGLALRALTEIDRVPGTIRLVFEPGEESVPGGAVRIVEEGWIDGARAVLGLHCDPKLDLGQIGLRLGPLTAAADSVVITLTGPGGHTSRPHLTVNLIEVMGRLATHFPAEVVRRIASPDDVVVVFGAVHAGNAANVIPAQGLLKCSVRCRDREAWGMAEEAVLASVAHLLEGTGADFQVAYTRGTPPVVNQSGPLDMLTRAARDVVGDIGIVEAQHSMGGDTFAWYGEVAPTAYARLGTHYGDHPRRDLHASTFDLDERAIGIGARLLAEAALLGLS